MKSNLPFIVDLYMYFFNIDLQELSNLIGFFFISTTHLLVIAIHTAVIKFSIELIFTEDWCDREQRDYLFFYLYYPKSNIGRQRCFWNNSQRHLWYWKIISRILDFLLVGVVGNYGNLIPKYVRLL